MVVLRQPDVFISSNLKLVEKIIGQETGIKCVLCVGILEVSKDEQQVFVSQCLTDLRLALIETSQLVLFGRLDCFFSSNLINFDQICFFFPGNQLFCSRVRVLTH